MPGHQLTNAERRLLREQSGLGLLTTLGWLGLVLCIIVGLGGIALAWWGYELVQGGTALLAMAP